MLTVALLLMVMLPAVPLLALEVAIGLLTVVVTVRSSAKAGLARLASRIEARRLRFTVPPTEL
jgi:hypothetical protein